MLVQKRRMPPRDNISTERTVWTTSSMILSCNSSRAPSFRIAGVSLSVQRGTSHWLQGQRHRIYDGMAVELIICAISPPMRRSVAPRGSSVAPLVVFDFFAGGLLPPVVRLRAPRCWKDT